MFGVIMNKKSIRTWMIIHSFVVLTACGGGSGGSGGSSNDLPTYQPTNEHTLHFANPGSMELDVGDTDQNQATSCCIHHGPGVGYRSSDTSVATVDNTGTVYAVGPGTAMITATMPPTGSYKESSSFYQVIVVDPPRIITRAGVNNTLITADNADIQYELYRSRNDDCDFANYLLCSHGQMDILNGNVITDTSGSLAHPAIYSLWSQGERLGDFWANPSPMPPRSEFQLVSFKGRLWLYGGIADWIYKPQQSIWSSKSGAHWRQETTSAPFGPRRGHEVVEFDNRLYLIGGHDGDAYRNDVWVSDDGVTWQQLVANAEFEARSNHQVLVFQDSLWLIGGRDIELKNDVWRSNNGITWQRINGNAEFVARFNHRSVVFQDRLWVIGGASGSFDEIGDVWSSPDGIAWELMYKEPWSWNTRNPPLRRRQAHEAIVFDNKMWVVGGNTSPYRSDVWSSSDGREWELLRADAGFLPRYNFQLVFHDNRFVLAGGFNGWSDSPYDYFRVISDVWFSTNLNKWRILSSNSDLPWHGGKNIVSHAGKLVAHVSSGLDLQGRYNGDVKTFISTDGIHWRKRSETLNCSQGVGGIEVTAFNNKLWWIGGSCSVEEAGDRGSLLSSEDGIQWTVEPQHFPLYGITGYQSLVFNNQLWVIGGRVYANNYGYSDDVWSSMDGTNWTLRNGAPGFTPSEGSQVVFFNNRLWLIGGTHIHSVTNGNTISNTPRYHAQLWSSGNGIDWVSHTVSSQLSQRAWHKVIAYKDRLWLVGGRNAYAILDDIWVSDDGLNWSLFKDDAEFGRVMGHNMFARNGLLYLVTSDGETWESEDVSSWRKVEIHRIRHPR